MPFCQKCNVEYKQGKKFCKRCGTPLSSSPRPPYCRKCNIEYEQGDKFCKECGSSLIIQKKSKEEQTQQVPLDFTHLKGNVQADKAYPVKIPINKKFNKYLVPPYFIAAAIYFLFSVIFYYQDDRQIFFTEFVFFTVILTCGFLLGKIKTSNLAINIIFSLLLVSYIIYLINIICVHFF
jgi:hypothetical protein